MSRSPPEPKPCRLCGRITRRGTTEHHLIPRTCHSNKWFKRRYSAEMQQTISVCHECHRAIHRFVPREKDLGRHHNTIETLLAHEQIWRFVNWVKDQK